MRVSKLKHASKINRKPWYPIVLVTMIVALYYVPVSGSQLLGPGVNPCRRII